MIGHLYRYPHPFEPNKFIYVGQGANRDYAHRSGVTSFGRRFKREFPGVELPLPIREEVEVQSQVELNEEETIRIFWYHMWHGYSGGMNLTLPGIVDYIEQGKIGGRISGRMNVENGHMGRLSDFPRSKTARIKTGKILGDEAVRSGRISRLNKLSAEWTKNNPEQHKKIASMGGSKARDLKTGVHALSSEQHIENGRKAGLKAVCNGQIKALGIKNSKSGHLDICRHARWHVRRNLISESCSFCKS